MFINVTCGYCDQDYDIYERDSLTSANARKCPHCGSKIDRDLWLSTVVPAFKTAQVANWALHHNYVENHEPLFAVSFIADHIFRGQETENQDEL